MDTAETAAQAIAAAADRPPGLAIVVDLGLPDMDGLQVIAQLRRSFSLPILVLSARGEHTDKVAALAADSDDHISKPFGMQELLARVRAALCRTGASRATATVRTAAFVLDLAARTASTPAGPANLTPTEWHLLEELVRQPGSVVPQLALLRAVWGEPYAQKSRHYLRACTWPSCEASSRLD